MGALEIRLFGEVSIQRDAFFLPTPPAKALELLCYLLVYRDRVHSRESLADLLWPDAATSVSKRYLRQALWRLSTTLRQRAAEPTGEPLLVIDPDLATVNAGRAWLDIEVFERAYTAVRDTPGQLLTESQARDLEYASALYRGDLMTASYYDWCGQERDRLQLIYLSMLERLMDYCEVHALYATGTAHGQVVLRNDPARETTHRRLMRMHYAAGDRASAIRQYERCVEVMAAEFGVGPSAETTALHEQICADQVGTSGWQRRQHVAPDEVADLRVRLDQIQASLVALQDSLLGRRPELAEGAGGPA